MKRFSIFVTVFALLLLSVACSGNKEDKTNCVQFYYTCREIDYESGAAVFVAEERENVGELETLLGWYLQGPTTENAKNPFPADVALIQAKEQDGVLEVVLSKEFATLSGMELTLACGALSKTCFSLSEATEIRISAEDSVLDGAKYITITPNSLLLVDNSAEAKGGSQ